MEIKKLELKYEGSLIKRLLASAHFKKTTLYSLLGVIIGYALFYFEQGGDNYVFWNEDALTNVLIGFGFGIFLTNSPCARGRC